MSVNYITDDVKALIGARSGPALAYHPVEASEVRRFFQAIMDPAPRYWDEASAKSSRYGGLVAPPAFAPFAFRNAPAEPDPLDRMRSDPDFDGLPRSGHRGLPAVPVPLPRLLNGGYEYEFYRYARVGERIYRSSTYLDIYQRDGRSGPMVLIITEQKFTTDHDVPLITATTTTILR
jgi:acyl dehydratase